MSGRAVVLAAVAAGALAGVVALPGARALEGPGTIRITGTQLRHAYVDVGKKGRSPGDVDVYTQLLFNKRIQQNAIGRATMVCTGVGANGQSCSATYVLPQGEIVVQGVIGTRLIYELVVVGGTGLYDNVRGSLTVTSLRRKPSRELLVFRLVV
jgi:hypothetical protein